MQNRKAKTNTNPSPDPNRYRRRCPDPSARIQKLHGNSDFCDSGLSPTRRLRGSHTTCQGPNFGLKMGESYQEGRRWHPWVPRRDVNSPGGAQAENGFYCYTFLSYEDRGQILHLCPEKWEVRYPSPKSGGTGTARNLPSPVNYAYATCARVANDSSKTLKSSRRTTIVLVLE